MENNPHLPTREDDPLSNFIFFPFRRLERGHGRRNISSRLGVWGRTYAAVYGHSRDVPLRQGWATVMSRRAAHTGSSRPHVTFLSTVSACALGCQKSPAGQLSSRPAPLPHCHSRGVLRDRTPTETSPLWFHAKLAQGGFNSRLRPGLCDLPGDAPQNPTLSQAHQPPQLGPQDWEGSGHIRPLMYTSISYTRRLLKLQPLCPHFCFCKRRWGETV